MSLPLLLAGPILRRVVGMLAARAVGDPLVNMHRAEHVRLRSRARWELEAARSGLSIRSVIPLYRWLQHVSTVVGSVVVAAYGVRRLGRQPVVPRRPIGRSCRGSLALRVECLAGALERLNKSHAGSFDNIDASPVPVLLPVGDGLLVAKKEWAGDQA